MADLIVYNSSFLVTMKGGPKKGSEMKDIGKICNGWFAIENGKFISVGEGAYDESLISENTLLLDADQKLILPGFVDSHTHLVYGGSRENELKMKLDGVPYLDILKAGGGILSTVNSTRRASFEELYDKSLRDLNTMLKYGVTTIEAKSGYGLNLETEIKQLKVASALNENHPIDIVNTFLGAHAIPREYKSNKSNYVKEIVSMLNNKEIKEHATFCDIFCEDAVFNPEDSRQILSAAKEAGFKLKIHADEIVDLGGAKLASDLGSTSADHLMATSDSGIKALAKSGVVANILPTTSFNLNKDYANARKMIDEGCYVAISTDYNPGSAPSANLPFAMYLAANKMNISPEEVLCAVTINAAKAIGRENKVGSIEIGKSADFVIYDCENLEYLFYNFGKSHVQHVFKNGDLVVMDGDLFSTHKGGCNGCG